MVKWKEWLNKGKSIYVAGPNQVGADLFKGLIKRTWFLAQLCRGRQTEILMMQKSSSGDIETKTCLKNLLSVN